MGGVVGRHGRRLVALLTLSSDGDVTVAGTGCVIRVSTSCTSWTPRAMEP